MCGITKTGISDAVISNINKVKLKNRWQTFLRQQTLGRWSKCNDNHQDAGIKLFLLTVMSFNILI